MAVTTRNQSSGTDWSLISDAASLSDARAAADALERISRRYWPAIYAFIRSSGRDVHEAADLTQGFICDVVLSRSLLHSADPKRGRFRNLLLHALQNYMREQHRNKTRRKRTGPGPSPRVLEYVEEALVHQQGRASDPEDAFMSQWAATLVRQVLEAVRARCSVDGWSAHWRIFEQRVVRPMLLGQPALPYADLVAELHLKDASQASNMLITIKRRFVRALQEEVSRTMIDPSQVDEEIFELLRDLEK
jgi:DNA-directed RNA polymerase specialized sigma24 family protein